MITRHSPARLGSIAKPWTCPSCAHQSRRPFSSTPPSRIEVPRLTLHNAFTTSGVPGLFSATGYKLGWTTYQTHVLTKLNSLLAGDPDSNLSPKSLLLKYARDPQSASIFNHASMAFNNHFFYQSLSTAPLPLSKLSGGLESSLLGTFGSLETLRQTMLDTAESLFAPGFVWLVCTSAPGQPTWRILTTYAAGTPFPEAGYRLQPSAPGTTLNPSKPLGSFGSTSKAGQNMNKFPVGGTEVMPVLCVNTWEHAYIYDFGVDGKRKYLGDWWEAIDWHAVDGRTPEIEKSRGALRGLGRA
ncbi:hypothetical protein B0A48_07163 [Cryoendolithus antarcticus]|uniref:Manganese/iron superoxide dismutase C-terminal domain-containing protein n=1 Tax=Cryoendolithus antarcticus TaxID=1507870 RepID=A0A1V8T7S4_9PEZI|nr:hypothetical protein B0A48_07163 [Cryoendolithus antarcticus]